MISNLSMTNYRGFAHFELRDAARVNLIVGRNNSGKTSILEAIQLLVSGRDATAMTRIAVDRGEVVAPDDDGSGTRLTTIVDLSHFFHGHVFKSGKKIKIASDADECSDYNAEVISLSDLPPDRRAAIEVIQFNGEVQEYGIRIESPPDAILADSFIYGIDADGLATVWNEDRRSRPSFRRRVPGEMTPTAAFVSPASLDARSMSRMWSQMLRRGTEGGVTEALKSLDPGVKEVHFPPSAASNAGAILIGFDDRTRRVPLGSMGDGMRRMLALSLALAYAKGGYLLVDEIDTGLHWTVMSDMWSLVSKAAAELDVQVFATTHSLDCLRGLAESADDGGVNRESVAVFRIDRDLPQAVRYGADELHYAVEQDTEIRGRRPR